jgi:hypothetical protein
MAKGCIVVGQWALRSEVARWEVHAVFEPRVLPYRRRCGRLQVDDWSIRGKYVRRPRIRARPFDSVSYDVIRIAQGD